MRWKPELAKAAVGPVEAREDLALPERLSAELQDRGLPAAAADMLVARLQPELDGRAPAELQATLDGVALGFRAQSSLETDLARSAGELQEIERLMGSFAGELTKLDEVLEVLAAYLRRMRTTVPASGSQILH